MDDGSTDDSYNILQEYAGKDNRIIVLQQKNAGAGMARNTGMKIARGEYLSILDSDDFLIRTCWKRHICNVKKTMGYLCVSLRPV